MASSKRRAEAVWNEKEKRWHVKVQKNGERRNFRSSTMGRRGKHDAEAAADEWLEKGTVDMRFGAAWKEYLGYQKVHNGTSNYQQIESNGRNHLLPALENKYLSKITPRMWQEQVDAAAGKGLSRRSCRNIKLLIGSFLGFCRRSRWEVDVPEKGDIIVPKSAPVGGKRILQPDALTKLFTIDWISKYGRQEHSFFIHAWRFCVVSGLRRGELCGLAVEDIMGDIVDIKRSINAQQEETTGKNDNARRKFALPQVALSVLEDQRAELESRGIISPWVFPDEYGNRLDSNHLYSMWATYRDQHELGCSLHELRHTFISVVRGDLPMPLLKGVVGHSEDMDTDGTYGHEVNGELIRAAKIVDKAFARVLKIPGAKASGSKSGSSKKNEAPKS